MKGKFLAVMIAFLIMGVGAFVAYVMGKYGGFTAIPWWDVLMWIFMCVLGILVLLILAVILLVASSLNGEEETPKMKNKPYKPLKTQKGHSAAQKKKPEKKLRVKKDKKPGTRKKQVKRENGAEKLDQIESPPEWETEEFE